MEPIEIYTKFSITKKYYGDFLTFNTFVGSYYNYSEEYIGTPIPGNESHLCGTGYQDLNPIWRDVTYSAIGYPYGENETTIDIEEDAPATKQLTAHLVRNETGLYSELIDTKSKPIIVSNNWSTGIDTPINYILFDYCTGNDESYTRVRIHEIAGVISFGNTLIDIPSSFLEDIKPPVLMFQHPVYVSVETSSTVLVAWLAYDFDSGLQSNEYRLNGGN